MPPLLAFNEDLFRDVLRAFDNLDERANKRANEFFCKYPGNESTDPGDIADWANDQSLAWWETMFSLRQSMVNLLAAGLYHLTEQQLGALSHDCGYERVRDTKLDVVKAWYMTNIGIDLATLRPWAKLQELRLVANSVKHAEGESAKTLRQLRPGLFQDPSLAQLRTEIGERWFHRQEPLAAPLAGEGLFVTEDVLREYCAAAVALFEGIVEFCEVHANDRFPLPPAVSFQARVP
jgi:hypothetical protein